MTVLHDEDVDEDLIKQLCDRFEGYELVELLQISIEDVIDGLRLKVIDNEEFLREFLVIGN